MSMHTQRDRIPAPPGGGATGAANNSSPTPNLVPAAPIVQAAPASKSMSKKLLLISALVVLLGGLLGLVAGQGLTAKTQAVGISRQVNVGQTVQESDLVAVPLQSDPNLKPIPYQSRSQVVGKKATVTLYPGQIVVSQNVTTEAEIPSGQALVPVLLKAGAYPSSALSPGLKTQFVASQAESANPAQAPGTGASIPATVANVSSPNPSTQELKVDVLVNVDHAHALAQLGSNVVMVLLPSSGK